MFVFRPRKYLHATQDETYRQGVHELHEMHQLADQVCRYDLDELDVAWLALNNAERELMGMYSMSRIRNS